MRREGLLDEDCGNYEHAPQNTASVRSSQNRQGRRRMVEHHSARIAGASSSPVHQAGARAELLNMNGGQAKDA